jgi:geranylgeranyl diphosphate synthase type I
MTRQGGGASRTGAAVGQQWLDAARALVDPGLREAIETLDPTNRAVAGYHLGFLDANGAPADGSRGKGVRGALALLSARAAGADVAVGIPAAVACELVHESSLLHDDIIDGDRVRRGARTAWVVFGSPSAIVAGDALLALAVEVLASAGNSPSVGRSIRELTAATREVMAGQSADLAFESRDSVTVEESREMVSRKTGALLGCAAALGAILAGAPISVSDALARYGRHIGMAFQLIDDLLGIWGEPERTGKAVWSDLRSRKKSLPVVAALNSETVAGQRLSQLYGSPDPLTEPQLAAAADAIEAAGGRQWAVDEAERETREALEILDSVDLADSVRDDFVAVTHMLVERDR